MESVDARDSLEGLPVMLTVPAAAGVLGIGRTLAYQLAERFTSGDPTGYRWSAWVDACECRVGR